MIYDRILAMVTGSPWLIEVEKGHAVAEIINRRLAGGSVSREDLEEYRRAEMARRDATGSRKRRANVALIPLYGVMTQRADWFTEVSGLCSTETVGRAVDEAAADPNVEAIVLDVDSPGGSAYGVQELGDKIAAAAKSKKVIAVANSVAASGAYWVASQASEFVVTPSGQVGSIGVYLMHTDKSAAMAASGVKVSFVSVGERKVAGNPYQPLDETGRAHMQEIADGLYAQFVRSVATGRGTTQTAVRGGFGRGGMVLADAAVKEGMADKVATLDSVLARYGVRLADVAPQAETVTVEPQFAAPSPCQEPAQAAPPAGSPTRSRERALEIRRRRMKLS